MNSASCDNEEVIIKLEEKTISKEEINDKVRLETNSLRKEMNILKEEIKKMKQILNEYALRLNYLELRDENIDTKIINKKSELDFIKNEFEEKYLKSNIKFNLLYRASRDGEHYTIMYTKIGNNNYHNLLLLFQTIKGVKFGAFLYKGLSKYYHNYNNYQNYNSIEPKSFIFSMDNNKIYYINSDDKIICMNSKCSNNNNQVNQFVINIYSNDLLSQEKK